MNDTHQDNTHVSPNPQSSSGDVDVLSRILEEGAAVDLHCHSRHSDGDWTPGSLIADAKGLGLQLISLTDHDTTAGQAAAAAAAREAGLLFLTGMEVSLSIDGRPYHVLCFDYDPQSPTWTTFAELRRKRFDLFYENQFQQLSDRGYTVSPDLARDQEGHFLPDPLPLALEHAGQAMSLEAAKQLVRGLGLRRPTELLYQDLEEFAAILQPGDAIFSIAHPARQEVGVSVRLSETDLDRFIARLPLVALEAFHPYHRESDVTFYRELASSHGLAVTCGSDAHGARFGRPLRRHAATQCEAFLRLIRDRWAARQPALTTSA
ncbi:MAG TPA: PHP domain-containing protein [Chloroflexota bacterium]|nr:PHP domain-containing protein [Chloroflexota bacterium]